VPCYKTFKLFHHKTKSSIVCIFIYTRSYHSISNHVTR